jgi:aminoglycoside phosphotransferase (APT) family kinase protein
VLALIGRHCAFDAPEVISESGDGWDVRRMVAGKFEPLRVYERVMREAGFARKVGERMGAVLACQHTAIPAVELADVGLPSKPSWPPPVAWAEERLPRATNDKSLVDRALRLLARYESEEARVTVRVLGHTDFGFHNIVIDATSGAVIGVFDYDSAAWCDPHHDFRYLLLDIEGEALLDGAAQVYEAATGVTLDRDRVRLLNAACAVAFLAFRAGSGPDEAPAGRTLAEDLRWTNLALRRAYA